MNNEDGFFLAVVEAFNTSTQNIRESQPFQNLSFLGYL